MSRRRPPAEARTATARGVALDALGRIEEGAYANLVLPGLLASSGLDARDRAFSTELVYGVTRMRRACDWLVDRFVDRPLDTDVRLALRLGAYQLHFLRIPPHAAVSATVDEAPRRAAGLVNAVLRKVAGDPEPEWPSLAVRLSYPDWVVKLLVDELAEDVAVAALQQMNRAPEVTERADGYVQDLASQWVAAYVGAQPRERVADLCAAPGGKATAMAAAGPAVVVSGDVSESRTRLVVDNAGRLGSRNVAVVVADGRRPALRPRSLNRVLVDAPCTGLGVLRRRPDARWRVLPQDVNRLATLQRELLVAAATLLRPGGTLVYSVCTLTLAETAAIDRWLAQTHRELRPLPRPGPPWEPFGRGARLLPQSAGTDGMYVVGLRRAGGRGVTAAGH
ncbi:MAG TPA: transcription antitermination factor NusB [Acidimicrobiales bacterium]|nr:transcription antitermination factor NusB [Acidimicrobiales bacterium]